MSSDARAEPREITVSISPQWLDEVEAREMRVKSKRRVVSAVDRVLLFAVIVAAWQAAVSGGLVRPFFASSPALIAEDLRELLSSVSFYQDIAITLSNALIGLLLGAATGTVLGLVFALSQRMGNAAQPILVAFNSLPRIALAPLFVVWLGFGPSSKILLATFAVFFLVFFNALSGVQQVDSSLVWNLRILGLGRMTIVRKIYLPCAAIWVVAALKTAISLAVTAAVVAEFVGSTAGLGYQMTNAIALLNTTRMFSVLVVLMVIGLALFGIVGRLERRLLKWQ